MKRIAVGKSMSSNRKHNEYKRLVGRLTDLYSSATIYQPTSDQFNGWIKRDVYDDPCYRMLTIAHKEYIRGVRDTLDGQLWRSMAWRLGPESGPLAYGVDGWKTETHNGPSILGDLSRSPNTLYGGHYWNGTDKPFTEYRCLNRPHCATCHHDDIEHEDKTGPCHDPNCGRSCQCQAFVKP